MTITGSARPSTGATGTPTPKPAPSSPNRVSTSGILGPSLASGIAVVLASIALGPLYDSGSWFGVSFITVAVVVAIGGVVTWARVPLFLVPIIQVVALFSILVARFTTDAPLGFVPTPDTVTQLRSVLSAGMADIDRYAPPVPYSDGVAAVTAIAIGCVAIVVFVLQVNLRMPVVAGAALLSVYAVPAFVLADGAPWWTFVAVAVGFMVLLISDERVGLVSWGRVLRRSEGGAARSAMAGLSSAALRLGAVAIVTAIALPILVPSLTDQVLGRNGSGTGEGPGTGSDPSQIGVSAFVDVHRYQLELPDTVVFRYSTSVANPGYLRSVVLEDYRSDRWTARTFQPADSIALDSGKALTTQISPTAGTPSATFSFGAERPFVTSWLPVPENATAIRGLSGQWFEDQSTGTVFGVDSSTKGATWQVDALQAPRPTGDQLAADVIGNSPDLESLRSNANVPQRVADLALKATANAKNNFQRALILQDYFRNNGFTYSTNVSSDQSSSAMDAFLDDKTGYCQQFAATMALMARAVGIPSRVVVGFTPGTKENGQWVVRGKDAHAWPELLFPTVGWVRFEPTPQVSGGPAIQVPDYPTQNTPTPVDTSPSTTTAKGPNGKAQSLLDPTQSTATAAGEGVGSGTSADQWRLRALLALLLVVLLLAAVPATWRWLVRRRRLSASASVEDAWEELRDTARDLGIEWSDARTPRQAVAGVIARQHLTGTAAEAAVRVGRVTERSRYAATPPSTDGLADDIGTVRTALLTRADRGARLRAVFLPQSLRRDQR